MLPCTAGRLVVYPALDTSLLELTLCDNPSLQVCIAIGLFDALAYLHGRGMLHRDVKAANIFLDEHMKPKLGDVGISRILREGDTATIGGNEVCSGTTSSYYCYLLVIYSWHTGHTCPLLIPCLLCVFQASLWYIDPDRLFSGNCSAGTMGRQAHETLG